MKRCQTIYVESICCVLSAASACKQKVNNRVVAAGSSSGVQRRPDNSASQKQTLETAEPRLLKLLELLTSTHRFSPSHFRDYLLLPSERELSDAVHGRAVTAHLLHKQREAACIRDNITSGSSDELRLERSFCNKTKKEITTKKAPSSARARSSYNFTAVSHVQSASSAGLTFWGAAFSCSARHFDGFL